MKCRSSGGGHAVCFVNVERRTQNTEVENAQRSSGKIL